MKRVTVIFEDEDHLKLKLHAVTSGRTMNDLINTAVQMYMHRIENSGKSTSEV